MCEAGGRRRYWCGRGGSGAAARGHCWSEQIGAHVTLQRKDDVVRAAEEAEKKRQKRQKHDSQEHDSQEHKYQDLPQRRQVLSAVVALTSRLCKISSRAQKKDEPQYILF